MYQITTPQVCEASPAPSPIRHGYFINRLTKPTTIFRPLHSLPSLIHSTKLIPILEHSASAVIPTLFECSLSLSLSLCDYLLFHTFPFIRRLHFIMFGSAFTVPHFIPVFVLLLFVFLSLSLSLPHLPLSVYFLLSFTSICLPSPSLSLYPSLYIPSISSVSSL